MLWTLLLFLLLTPLTTLGSSFPTLNQETARVCPFPWPEDISPCQCWENEKFQVFLICNMTNDVTERDILKLQHAFQCKNEIFSLDMNLNGHEWKLDITRENIGRFKMSYFRLTDYTVQQYGLGRYDYGFVKTGAFSLSKESLLGVSLKRIKAIDKYGDYIVPTILSRGQTVYAWDRVTKNSIETGAFSDLLSLTSITVDGGFREIHEGAFSNLPNLKELTLIGNGIEILHDNTFMNLPSLVQLNIKHNKNLKSIGNLFLNLQNPDLVANLTGNRIDELREEQFRPFFDNIIQKEGEGYIDLLNNPLQCGCDTKWYVASYADYQDKIRNAQCDEPVNGVEVQLEHETYIDFEFDFYKLNISVLENGCSDNECQNSDSDTFPASQTLASFRGSFRFASDPDYARLSDPYEDQLGKIQFCREYEWELDECNNNFHTEIPQIHYYGMSSDYPINVGRPMAKCPFPLYRDIYPCFCYMDNNNEVIIDCDVKDQEYANVWLQRLGVAFECNTRLKELNVNFTVFPENAYFRHETLGKFEITKLKISGSNFGGIRFEAGAFDGSLLTLEEIHVGDEKTVEPCNSYYDCSRSWMQDRTRNYREYRREKKKGWTSFGTETFSKLQKLKIISFGDVGRINIEDGAFKNLSQLVELNFENYTVQYLGEEAFSYLPALEILDLSNQLFEKIPTRAFYNLVNLKELKLNENIIRTIERKAFEELPSLEALDLSELSLTSLSEGAFYMLPLLKDLNLKGNVFKTLYGNIFHETHALKSLDLSSNYNLNYIGTILDSASANVYVNLTKTKIETIPESSFKVFFEKVLKYDGNGRVDLLPTGGNTFRCSCDVKWLLVSKMNVSEIINDITCPGGKSLNEVDVDFLERRCPQNTCSGYNPDFGRGYIW